MSTKDSLNMHQAVALDGIDAAENVLDRDSESVHQLDAFGHPPIHTAALYRNTAAVEFLLANGAHCDLFACCYLGRVEQAAEWLRSDRSLVRAVSAAGMTALHYAARSGDDNVTRLLIEAGADVNALDKNARTPLLLACHGGPWKRGAATGVIDLLIQHNANVDLLTAAAIGRADLVNSCLNRDSSQIDQLNDRKETAIFLAAKNSHLDVVRLLVDRGADINLADAVGTAALHRTSQQCSDELIQYLIDRGANAHLCCYVACGDVAGTCAALLRDPQSANEVFYEFNAVGYAIHSWQLDTLRVLLKNGCVLSEEDQQHIRRISGGDEMLLREFLGE